MYTNLIHFNLILLYLNRHYYDSTKLYWKSTYKTHQYKISRFIHPIYTNIILNIPKSASYFGPSKCKEIDISMNIIVRWKEDRRPFYIFYAKIRFTTRALFRPKPLIDFVLQTTHEWLPSYFNREKCIGNADCKSSYYFYFTLIYINLSIINSFAVKFQFINL